VIRVKLIFIFLAILFSELGVSQEFTLKGKIVNRDNDQTIGSVIVANKNLNVAVFGDSKGEFEIIARQNDTIYFSAFGYNLYRLWFEDSILSEEYVVLVSLKEKHYELSPVEVFPTKEITEIYDEIRELKVVSPPANVRGVDVAYSPITALWQIWSKLGREQTRYAQLINEQNKNDILKELLRLYASYDIINLNEDAYDDFILFCDISMHQIKTLDPYDLIMLIKGKYEIYSSR